jgi:hypothetical protein
LANARLDAIAAQQEEAATITAYLKAQEEVNRPEFGVSPNSSVAQIQDLLENTPGIEVKYWELF